ncbi:MAG: hypothetical protein ABMA14_09545, partial [Hyphomonadaceae bacterium]
MTPTAFRPRFPLLLAVFLVATACAPIPAQSANAAPPGSGDEDMVAQGRDIAMTNCSTCHAIDDERTSPNPAAPPLLQSLMR